MEAIVTRAAGSDIGKGHAKGDRAGAGWSGAR